MKKVYLSQQVDEEVIAEVSSQLPKVPANPRTLFRAYRGERSLDVIRRERVVLWHDPFLFSQVLRKTKHILRNRVTPAPVENIIYRRIRRDLSSSD